MNDEIRTAADLAKDPSSIGWITYAWVLLLSVFGGVVRVARELLKMEKTPREIALVFVVEMLTSGFAGLLTFFLCEASHINPMYTAVLTSVAGWMGVRALTVIEAIYKARIVTKD